MASTDPSPGSRFAIAPREPPSPTREREERMPHIADSIGTCSEQLMRINRLVREIMVTGWLITNGDSDMDDNASEQATNAAPTRAASEAKAADAPLPVEAPKIAS